MNDISSFFTEISYAYMIVFFDGFALEGIGFIIQSDTFRSTWMIELCERMDLKYHFYS